MRKIEESISKKGSYWNRKESWLWQGGGNAFTEVSSWTEGTKFRTGFWVWRTWFYWLSFLLASSRFIFPSPVSIYSPPFTGVGSNCWGISDRPYRNSFFLCLFLPCGDLSVKTTYSYWIIFRKRCSDIYITMEKYFIFAFVVHSSMNLNYFFPILIFYHMDVKYFNHPMCLLNIEIEIEFFNHNISFIDVKLK